MSSPRLSLAAAVTINLNIIIGSGIFINTVLLAQLAGAYSALTYVLVGLLIFPLMLSFAQLAQLHHGGSLYTYAAAINPFMGFLSSWSYFNTKLASCAVAVHVCVTLLRTVIPILNTIPILLVDGIVLALFTLLNCFDVQMGKRIQGAFVAGKLIPVVTVLISGLFLCSTQPFSVTPSAWGIFAGIPFVLYAFMGFESISGLSRNLQNPQDGARAIFISFSLGVIIITLFQLIFSTSIPYLGSLSNFQEAFPALVTQWGFAGTHKMILVAILHTCIALSAAGVAFGILHTNAWNLYDLAEKGHISRASFFLHRNVHAAPVRCIVTEAAIVASYLLLGASSLPALQQLAACGVTFTYLLSIVALWHSRRNAHWRRHIIPFAAIASCMLLLLACIRGIAIAGVAPAFIFVSFLLLGTLMFSFNKR